MGKARAVQDAIRKATDRAKLNMKRIEVVGSTIPHEVTAKHASAKVLLKPASPGTGVIAGGGVRAVLEAAGVKDVLTKSLGAKSKLNATYATLTGLTAVEEHSGRSARARQDRCRSCAVLEEDRWQQPKKLVITWRQERHWLQ